MYVLLAGRLLHLVDSGGNVYIGGGTVYGEWLMIEMSCNKYMDIHSNSKT